MNFYYKIFVLVVSILNFTTCGYSIYKSEEFKSTNIKSINVVAFDNKTDEPKLDLLITDYTIKELINHSSLVVTSKESADSILRGYITKYKLRPASIGSDNMATSYILTISISFTLEDNQSKELISSQRLVETETYSVTSDISQSEIAKESAKDRVGRLIARRLVDTLLNPL
ncbi:MAG: LPS assembly lipoprotein LptE [Nitrospinota bacterium]